MRKCKRRHSVNKRHIRRLWNPADFNLISISKCIELSKSVKMDNRNVPVQYGVHPVLCYLDKPYCYYLVLTPCHLLLFSPLDIPFWDLHLFEVQVFDLLHFSSLSLGVFFPSYLAPETSPHLRCGWSISAPLLTLASRASPTRSLLIVSNPLSYSARNLLGLHKQDVDYDWQCLLSYPSSEFSRPFARSPPSRWHHGEIKHWGWTTFHQGSCFLMKRISWPPH